MRVFKSTVIMGAVTMGVPTMMNVAPVVANAAKNTNVTEGDVTAPSTTSITVNKLMYDKDTALGSDLISNDGEAHTTLPKGVSKFDSSKYGKVGFTVYDITAPVKAAGLDPQNLSNANISAIIKDIDGADSEGEGTSQMPYKDRTNSKYVKGGTATAEKFVDAQGVAKFDNLTAYKDHQYHVYAVIETTSPKGLVYQKSQTMIVAAPMTNAAGNGWVSNVQLYPKNRTQQLQFKLHKVVEEQISDGVSQDKDLSGIKFDIYSGKPGHGTKITSAVTDVHGLITFKNLLMGDYYLVEDYTSLKDKVQDTSDTAQNDGEKDNALDQSKDKWLPNPSVLNDENNKLYFSITENGLDPSQMLGKVINYYGPDAKKESADKDNNGLGFDVGDLASFISTVAVPEDIGGGTDSITTIDKDGKPVKEISEPYDTFNYEDKAETGLTYEKAKLALVVKDADGNVMKEGTDYWLTDKGDGPAKSFNVNWIDPNSGKPSKAIVANKGRNITLEYKMLVNNDAVMANDLFNTYSLNYSNTPNMNDRHITGKVPVHTYGAKFKKISSGIFGTQIGDKALQGAKFVIKNLNEKDDDYGKYFNGYKDVDGDGLKEVVWVNSKKDVTDGNTDGVVGDATTQKTVSGGVLTSNKDGKFEIKGLTIGDYELEEIQAPKGYQMMNHTQHFKVTKTSYNNAGLEINIVNDEKPTIPLTGTLQNTVAVGVMALGLAAIGGSIYVYRKKRA